MTECKAYAANLEKKIIDEFKQKFREKLGYEPIVVTNIYLNENETLKLMSLDELAEYFDPFVPSCNNKKMKLFGPSRKRELVELRMIFCAIARSMKYTFTSIGSFIGGRDHTTVLHNVAVFKNMMETNEVFRQKYLEILTYIKQSNESSDLDQFDQMEYKSQPVILP